ncbi:MAG: SDR family NAD(P)-dependent oxidoreductase [Flavobacteriales bacterium]|nr:SDR family NAD(P)-dependent oxidoreductase [Flavobacteriales bacterium]
MTVAYITGASRGLGKALAELLLQEDDIRVVGLSRQQTIEHHNYRHIVLDLSDIEVVERFRFPVEEYDKYILINNAGVIEPIGHVGHDFSTNILANFNVNLVSPSLLMNMFMRQFSTRSKEMQIINVSSGAGKYPIDGWSSYNASKAGIDMFSLVLNEELKKDNVEHIKVFSIAPGVVDTDMQGVIRSSDETKFSNIDKFKDLYNDGQLSCPESVAKLFKKVIDKPNDFPDVILDVRNF